jgi:hypothetical protein
MMARTEQTNLEFDLVEFAAEGLVELEDVVDGVVACRLLVMLPVPPLHTT